MTTITNDIVIIGTGPVGLITAIAITSHTERNITLIGPKPSPDQIARDTRTTAFMQPSLQMLESCGLNSLITQNDAPLKHLRMIDDCGNLLRAPDCNFSASELGLDYFAQNIPNTTLLKTLIDKISTSAKIHWHETEKVTSVTPHPTHIDIITNEGDKISALLCIGADGRNSISRAAANIETETWTYDQTAISCSFTHTLPHQAISTEIHRKTGPMTLIPLTEYHSSLVWSLKPDEAVEITKLNDEQFKDLLYKYSHAILGKITSAEKRVSFPISGLKVKSFAANRIALVGEAAHIVPPIGAQGMNLGLRDAAFLTELLQDVNLQEDITEFEEAYNKARRSDVWSRTTTIDLLNKSLLLPYLPLKTIRTLGLNIINSMKPLRNYIMQQGLGGSDTLPKMMRSSAEQS